MYGNYFNFVVTYILNHFENGTGTMMRKEIFFVNSFDQVQATYFYPSLCWCAGERSRFLKYCYEYKDKEWHFNVVLTQVWCFLELANPNKENAVCLCVSYEKTKYKFYVWMICVNFVKICGKVCVLMLHRKECINKLTCSIE